MGAFTSDELSSSSSHLERRTRRQKRADAPLLETDSGECKIVPLRCLYLCGIRECVCVCVCVCVPRSRRRRYTSRSLGISFVI